MAGPGILTPSVERASGQHAKNLLVIVKDASGVADEIWDAIESLKYSNLVAISNPIRAEGRFIELIRQADQDRADQIPQHRLSVRSRFRALIHPMLTWKSRPMELLTAPGSTHVIDATAAPPSGCVATFEPSYRISLPINSSLNPGSITRPPYSGRTFPRITPCTGPAASPSMLAKASAATQRRSS